jgi:hypothetical protein
MRVQLHSTDTITNINGVPARVWEGVTENGIRCHAFITRIAVGKDDDASEFELELKEQHAPISADLRDAIPLRMII